MQKRATKRKTIAKKDSLKQEVKPNIKISKINAKRKTKIKKILIGQAAPTNNRSPFLNLAQTLNITIDFTPFISIEGIDTKEIKQQKIKFQDYSIIIFTSKNAIDYFFKIVQELNIFLHDSLRYLCTSESAFGYFKKFKQFRKRKVKNIDPRNKVEFNEFFLANKKMNFLFIYSIIYEIEVVKALTKNKCKYTSLKLYNVISKDIKKELKKDYQIICLFSPGGIKSIFDNDPEYKKNNTLIYTYGHNTHRVALQYGLEVDLQIKREEKISIVDVLKKVVQEYNN